MYLDSGLFPSLNSVFPIDVLHFGTGGTTPRPFGAPLGGSPRALPGPLAMASKEATIALAPQVQLVGPGHSWHVQRQGEGRIPLFVSNVTTKVIEPIDVIDWTCCSNEYVEKEKRRTHCGEKKLERNSPTVHIPN